MSTAETERGLYAVTKGNTVILRMQGPGAFSIGPVLKHFGGLCADEGFAVLVLDLAKCNIVDSTFLGIVAGLAMKFKRRPGGGRVILVGANEDIAENSKTLGLVNLVAMLSGDELARELPDLSWDASSMRRIDLQQPAGTTLLRQTMIEAHDNLISISDANAEIFKNVLAVLRQSEQNNGKE